MAIEEAPRPRDGRTLVFTSTGRAGSGGGAGPGTGDALVVQAGAATPVFAPFAATPIAGTGATSCD